MKLIDLFEIRKEPSQNIIIKATKELYQEYMSVGSDDGATMQQIIYDLMRNDYIPYQETGDSVFDVVKINSRKFQTALKKYCLDEVEDKYHELMAYFHGSELPIWRVITAPKNWQPDPEVHPGIYWSWSETVAEEHCGNFRGDHVKWRLYTEAKYEQIDWVSTLTHNCSVTSSDEKEITLYNVSIKILDYQRI